MSRRASLAPAFERRGEYLLDEIATIRDDLGAFALV